MKLVALKTYRKTTNSLYILDNGRGKLLVKRYNGINCLDRCLREKYNLQQWLKAGYHVPEIRDIKVEIDGPYLVMRYIDGMSMRQYLSSQEVDISVRLECVRNFFHQSCRRHQSALKENNPAIIHYDANTGNVICVNNEFYFIDFEASAKNNNVLVSAGIELATICRWIVRDVSIDFIDDVISLMVSEYAGLSDLLRLIVKRTNGRPFQFYHRRKDRHRKKADPHEVTKYDIADCLKKHLSAI